MSETLYASFRNSDDAERATGALLDHGVRSEDISLVRKNPSEQVVHTPMGATGSVYGTDEVASQPVVVAEDPQASEETAKHGITTTTAGDAGAGAIAGTVVGVGVGAIAAIASMLVPGVGLVLGAGALASALGGVAATAGAGAAAGAIVGYLKDMGVDDERASEFSDVVNEGGAVLAVALPSGVVNVEEARTIIAKYGGSNVNTYARQDSTGYVA